MSVIKLVNIRINGEPREVTGGINLEQLLDQLELPVQRIAVELNRKVIRRAEWTNTVIEEGDRLEIVHFVGGGN